MKTSIILYPSTLSIKEASKKKKKIRQKKPIRLRDFCNVFLSLNKEVDSRSRKQTKKKKKRKNRLYNTYISTYVYSY